MPVSTEQQEHDVLISIRLDDASGNWTAKERYVYSIRFRDNKTAATSVASPASSKVLHQGDVAAVTDMVSIDQPVVNPKSLTNTDSNTKRNISHDKRFHNLKYIEKVADNIPGLTYAEMHSADTVRDISTTKCTVADLYEFVKQHDPEFN